MSLNFEVFSEHHDLESCAPVVIVPGLFGSVSNWRQFAKKLSESSPVFVVDVRNHGRSPHYDSHSYLDIANDLNEFCVEHNLNKIIPCGHSMGGKAAMVFSLLFAERVAALLVLDIAPVSYRHSHAPFLDALMQIDVDQIESRKHADQLLKPVITEQSVRLFLLQSLVGRAGEFSWRLNLPVLQRFMPEIVGFPAQELKGKTSNVPMALVSGADSSYVDDNGIHLTKTYFNKLSIETIAGAGHWLHIDQPSRVLAAVNLFLRKVD